MSAPAISAPSLSRNRPVLCGISYEVRIDKACGLLKCTTLRTAEIGERVGYNDPHYFSSTFKDNGPVCLRVQARKLKWLKAAVR